MDTLADRDLLFPLSNLADDLAGDGVPLEVEPLEEPGRPAMPEPYRSLLVHERDMTSTLEEHHGEELEISLLERRLDDLALWRRVVLVGRESGRIHEAGAIRIALAPFASAARREILEGKRPLGAILARHGVEYRSRPRLFFGFRSTPRSDVLLGFAGGGRRLYGRRNELETPTGEKLAEVVEILPPRARDLGPAVHSPLDG